jgi:hypothetical protein
MSSIKLSGLLAIAAIGASAGRGHEINSAYTQERNRRYAEQDKALAKKQRVREQIRARRAEAKKSGVQ